MKSLIGKRLYVHFDRKHRLSPSGFHGTEVKRVETSKDGTLKSVTISMFNALTGQFDGRKVKVQPNEWSTPACGVIWFGKLRPVKEVVR